MNPQPTEMLRDLTKLGLDEHAARVYLGLVECGETVNVGTVLSKTRLHRQAIYDAAERLAAKGLVAIGENEQGRTFSAEDPTRLIRVTEQQRKDAKAIVPELLKIAGGAHGELDVRVFTGSGGLMDSLTGVVLSAARTDNIVRIIAGSPARYFWDALQGDGERYLRLCEAKKIRKEVIAPGDYPEEYRSLVFGRGSPNELRIASAALSSPSGLRITKELVAIELFRPRLMVIHIRSATIALGYLEYFNHIWAATGASRAPSSGSGRKGGRKGRAAPRKGRA